MGPINFGVFLDEELHALSVVGCLGELGILFLDGVGLGRCFSSWRIFSPEGIATPYGCGVGDEGVV